MVKIDFEALKVDDFLFCNFKHLHKIVYKDSHCVIVRGVIKQSYYKEGQDRDKITDLEKTYGAIYRIIECTLQKRHDETLTEWRVASQSEIIEYFSDFIDKITPEYMVDPNYHKFKGSSIITNESEGSREIDEINQKMKDLSDPMQKHKKREKIIKPDKKERKKRETKKEKVSTKDETENFFEF